jgi:hypothetical protein
MAEDEIARGAGRGARRGDGWHGADWSVIGTGVHWSLGSLGEISPVSWSGERRRVIPENYFCFEWIRSSRRIDDCRGEPENVEKPVAA